MASLGCLVQTLVQRQDPEMVNSESYSLFPPKDGERHPWVTALHDITAIELQLKYWTLLQRNKRCVGTSGAKETLITRSVRSGTVPVLVRLSWDE